MSLNLKQELCKMLNYDCFFSLFILYGARQSQELFTFIIWKRIMMIFSKQTSSSTRKKTVLEKDENEQKLRNYFNFGLNHPSYSHGNSKLFYVFVFEFCHLIRSFLFDLLKPHWGLGSGLDLHVCFFQANSYEFATNLPKQN